VFLKNAGSCPRSVFRYPVVIQHWGKPLFFGQHECGATVGDLAGGLGLSDSVRERHRLTVMKMWTTIATVILLAGTVLLGLAAYGAYRRAKGTWN